MSYLLVLSGVAVLRLISYIIIYISMYLSIHIYTEGEGQRGKSNADGHFFKNRAGYLEPCPAGGQPH